MKNLNKNYALLFCSILFLFTTTSCEKETISTAAYQIQYHRTAQLQNTYVNEILPLCDDFIQASEALKKDVLVFKESKTMQELEKTQLQWKEMIHIWKRLELYNIGAVEDSFIHFEINRWPTDIGRINANIEGVATLDENFVASIGSSSKGISALEFLLFSSLNAQEVLSSFTLQPNGQRRFAYLEALSNNLIAKSKVLKSLWVNDKEAFVTSLGSGISGTQSQLTNAMITLIEEIVISKLGAPLGETSGGQIAVDALEAYRSESSLLLIQEHLNSLQRCYTGNYVDKAIKWGYDDYLILIGREKLNNRILNSFKHSKERLDAIKQPLYQEIVMNKQYVLELQNAFTELLILIKVDMANAIGSTVTINDNDGD